MAHNKSQELAHFFCGLHIITQKMVKLIIFTTLSLHLL